MLFTILYNYCLILINCFCFSYFSSVINCWILLWHSKEKRSQPQHPPSLVKINLKSWYHRDERKDHFFKSVMSFHHVTGWWRVSKTSIGVLRKNKLWVYGYFKPTFLLFKSVQQNSSWYVYIAMLTSCTFCHNMILWCSCPLTPTFQIVFNALLQPTDALRNYILGDHSYKASSLLSPTQAVALK